MFWNDLAFVLFNVFVCMNLKHEMFWNIHTAISTALPVKMNLKHEMFWNVIEINIHRVLKSHEP